MNKILNKILYYFFHNINNPQEHKTNKMLNINNIPSGENINKDSENKVNKVEIIKSSQNEELKIKTIENTNAKSLKPIHILLIILGIIIITVVIIILAAVLTKKKEQIKFYENYKINENNMIQATLSENFEFPSDQKIQVVGANFQHKNSILIFGISNNIFTIDDNGMIEGVTKDDFPLTYSFTGFLTNCSSLFKDVKCFKTIDLSKMNSSKIIDASNMFENSNFEEIYFGTDNSESSSNTRYLDENNTSEIENYFDTSKIESANELFLNCKKLKKIQLTPSFNVGRKAKGMFKGCSKLEEVNTKSISSTEVEEMESMFEDCQSLKEISFSNDFLTGEIKTLTNVFKNTNLNILDISYLRLYSLESYSNIFDGASIKGTLKIGKHYSNENVRDNLFREIAKVTDPNTEVFTPKGTSLNQLFGELYYKEKKVRINVNVIDIDYNIHYKENKSYKLYSDYLHVGLGWDFNANNTYDLDSSIVTFDYNLNHLRHVYFANRKEYNGTIVLNGDDVTGEGDGDDEEIMISLDLLPPGVEIFTVQLNSYRRNSLRFVESAYIQLSADNETIGTFSINDAGNNIGLLIGSFSKSKSNEWYFRPLKKVIPGYIVTHSIPSIQAILHSVYEKRLMSAEDFVNRLMVVADDNSIYSQAQMYNSLYWNGTHWFADCSNLIKSIINGRNVYNPEINSYQRTFSVVEDVNANNLITKCNDISSDFTTLESGVPRLLHLKDNRGNGHVGVYLGKILTKSKGKVNVIESTTSWGANAVIYSWVDNDGTRRFYEGGPLSEMRYNWTSHGSLDKWISY